MHLFTALAQWLRDYSRLLYNEQGYNYLTVVMKKWLKEAATKDDICDRI